LPIPQDLKHVLDALPLPRGADQECRYYFWNGTTSERAMKGIAERTLAAVFRESSVAHAHAHRFRHTLATELLGRGASFEDMADILGNSPEIVRKHYAKWSPARQARIDELMERVHSGATWAQMGDASFQILFAFPDVGIDLFFVSQIESDHPIHLFEAE
jgi:integrase